jgi:hypothetical protein
LVYEEPKQSLLNGTLPGDCRHRGGGIFRKASSRSDEMEWIMIVIWLLCVAWFVWMCETAPQGTEDENGFRLIIDKEDEVNECIDEGWSLGQEAHKPVA